MSVLEEAVHITGWTDVGDLTYLIESAQKSKTIAEIGSWQGRSTYALAKSTPGKVYAIDTWKGSHEHQKELKEKDPEWLFNEFKKNTEGLPVEPVRMTSLEAASMFLKKGMQFDLIFIDASHDFHNVSADIIEWRKLLTPGGILCGHDYEQGWPDVIRAVNSLIPLIRVPEKSTIWTTEI